MDQPFATKVEQYLARILQKPDLQVLGVKQLAGGISRAAWRVDTSLVSRDGSARSFVFRLDPKTSLLDSSRSLEYAMYRKFRSVPGVPVPEALCAEDDPEPLGATFLATALVPGVAEPGKILDATYRGARIARQMFDILGLIATAECTAGLEGVLEEPACEDVCSIQLDHWETVLCGNDIGPMPVTSAAIRKLRRAPPPAPQRLSVVHGDYRIGNFLFSSDGITAILDWEMAHFGDALEDLAWALARNWRLRAAPDRVAGFLSPDEAIRAWEQASGLKAEHDALRWWVLFSHVKAAALWVTGARRFIDHAPRDVTYAVASWRHLAKQELWMMQEMGVAT